MEVYVSLFLVGLIPLNYFRAGQGIIRRLRLNNAWGVFCLSALLFAVVYVLPVVERMNTLGFRTLCLLGLAVLLLAAGPADLQRHWFTPMALLGLGSWWFAKLLLKGRNGFGLQVAVAVAAWLLSSMSAAKLRSDKKQLAKIAAYLLLMAAVLLLYMTLFEPESLKVSFLLFPQHLLHRLVLAVKRDILQGQHGLPVQKRLPVFKLDLAT